jgi:3-dehydroquinate dehydratase-2
MKIPLVHILHGPNLNRLGLREPAIYGATTLAELDARLADLGERLGLSVVSAQTNGEGEYVSLIHAAADAGAAGLVVNPGAYTHTSIAIRDALAAVALPFVEVHLTNVYAREAFRHHSTVAATALGRVMGFGPASYDLALRGLGAHLGAAPR